MNLGEALTACIPRLRRYARALHGEAADDLVQDTLERAWRKSHQWDRGRTICPWLFSIMHNLHIDQRRKPHMETLPLEDSLPETALRAPQESLIAARDLQEALQLLPVEQREVLLLVAVEQMKYRDVAVTLGIPQGTVMSRLSRGRDRLRELLEGTGGKTSLKVVK